MTCQNEGKQRLVELLNEETPDTVKDYYENDNFFYDPVSDGQGVGRQ